MGGWSGFVTQVTTNKYGSRDAPGCKTLTVFRICTICTDRRRFSQRQS